MVAVTGKTGGCQCGYVRYSLDDTSWLVPDAHYWTRSKQVWTALPVDVPCHETHE